MSTTELLAEPRPLPSGGGRPRSKWPLVLICLSAFGAGAVAGGGVAALRLEQQMESRMRHPERMPSRIVDEMRERLSLTPEQSTKAEEIVQRRFKAMDQLRREMMPRYGAELDGMEQELDALFTAEQQATWDAYIEELRSRRYTPHRSRHHGKDGKSDRDGRDSDERAKENDPDRDPSPEGQPSAAETAEEGRDTAEAADDGPDTSVDDQDEAPADLPVDEASTT